MNKISFYGNSSFGEISKGREEISEFAHSAQEEPVETTYYFVKEGSLNDEQKQYIKSNFFKTSKILITNREFTNIPNNESEVEFLKYMNSIGVDVDIQISHGVHGKNQSEKVESPKERNNAIDSTAKRITDELKGVSRLQSDFREKYGC